MVYMIREEDSGAAAQLLDEKWAMQAQGWAQGAKCFKKSPAEAKNLFRPDIAILNVPAKAFEA